MACFGGGKPNKRWRIRPLEAVGPFFPTSVSRMPGNGCWEKRPNGFQRTDSPPLVRLTTAETSHYALPTNRKETNMSKKDTSNSSTVPGAASPHILPPLPYAENALKPVITGKTMSFHYGKHHN